MYRINQLTQEMKHKNALTTVSSNHRESHLGNGWPCTALLWQSRQAFQTHMDHRAH